MLKYLFNFRFNQLCWHFLLAVSTTRVLWIFFGKTSNESNNNQTRILVVGTDFATYNCIANEECASDIKIEDTATCWCNELVQAFLVIIALPCVFNIAYSKKFEAAIADVARDKQQPENTTENVILDLLYWETWF